jgi:hypothetical protein
MQHRAGLTATKATSAAAKATINAALRAQPGPLTRLADRDATTEAVFRVMPNHTTLHFPLSRHRLLEPAAGQLPGARRACAADPADPTDEGRLWGARLYFLSACDSGVAGTAAPQEVVALPSALIQLGAAAVIASQWPVSYTTAAVLALRFYQACADGVPRPPLSHRPSDGYRPPRAVRSAPCNNHPSPCLSAATASG